MHKNWIIFAKIISKRKPDAFLLENVKNLKYHNKGNTYQTIMNTLAILPEIGMTVLQGQNIKHNIVNKLSDN